MTASEEIKEFIGVESLVHWDGEKILFGVLIVYNEVVSIVIFKGITGLSYLVTTRNTRLESRQLMTINVESHRIISYIYFVV